jgi:uncharacterized protein
MRIVYNMDAVTDIGSIKWAEHHVEARAGGAWLVPPGGLLRVTDIEGSQTGDVFLVDAADVSDGLSNGRSFDYNDTIFLSLGSQLYSSRSKVLATIIADDVGRHDFLYTPCSQEMYELQNGVTEPHPNCYDNLTGALAEFGVPASTVTVAFNVFMVACVAADGRLTVSPARSRKGDSITFRAERAVFAAVSSCPADACNGGGSRPLQVSIGVARALPTAG